MQPDQHITTTLCQQLLTTDTTNMCTCVHPSQSHYPYREIHSPDTLCSYKTSKLISANHTQTATAISPTSHCNVACAHQAHCLSQAYYTTTTCSCTHTHTHPHTHTHTHTPKHCTHTCTDAHIQPTFQLGQPDVSC